jgi:hypothetical protein
MSVAQAPAQRLFKDKLCKASMEAPGMLLRAPTVVQPPSPLFGPGQYCNQWWATWFKTAQTPLDGRRRTKNRPAWYSGEVLCYEGYGSIMYAGIQQPEMHCYKCY